MNKFCMVRKNIHKNERMFRCLILRSSINGRGMLDNTENFRGNGKDERINIIHSVCMYARRNNLRR